LFRILLSATAYSKERRRNSFFAATTSRSGASKDENTKSKSAAVPLSSTLTIISRLEPGLQRVVLILRIRKKLQSQLAKETRLKRKLKSSATRIE
jgi:hypothetical protein